MKLRIITLFFLITLNSCSNYENLSKSANLIAEYCGTSDVSVGTSKYMDTDNRNVEAFEIKIKNINEIDNNVYNPELLASYSAKILSENLTENDKKDKDLVNVIIESENKKYQYKYSLNEVKLIENYFEISKEFFLKLKSKEYDKMYDDFVDKKIIAKELFKNEFIDKVVAKNEKVFDKINSIELNGFNISKIKNNDVVEILSSSKLSEGTLSFSARFFKNGKGKIVGFEVN
jgi:hypothetical protein